LNAKRAKMQKKNLGKKKGVQERKISKKMRLKVKEKKVRRKRNERDKGKEKMEERNGRGEK
jgi:hypothetical protein